MPVNKREEEAKYKKKIADLHGELEKAAKQLNERQSERDEAKRETTLLLKEKAKLQGDVADLSKEVTALEDSLTDKRREAVRALKTENDLASRARLEKDSLEFGVKQLRAKAADLQSKLAELPQVQERHTEAKARLATAEAAVKEAREAVQKARLDADGILSAARDRDEKSKLREAKAADAETDLKNRFQHLEFYRARLVAYCNEKGLPPPPAYNDGQA